MGSQGMIKYKTGTAAINWKSLFELYTLTDGVIGLAKKQEHDRIIAAFEASYKIVTAWHDDKIVGCGRMISDGYCYAWIHDVAVHPEYRRQNIGRELMAELQSGDEHLLMGLTSSFEAVEFYAALEFKKHKTCMAKYPGNSTYLENG